MSDERQNNGLTAADRSGIAVRAAQGAKIAGTGAWDWIDKRRVIARAIIIVTIYLTIRVIEWAMNLPFELPQRSGTDIALIQAAVLGPWGLLQAAMFKLYGDLMKSNGQV